MRRPVLASNRPPKQAYLTASEDDRGRLHGMRSGLGSMRRAVGVVRAIRPQKPQRLLIARRRPVARAFSQRHQQPFALETEVIEPIFLKQRLHQSDFWR